MTESLPVINDIIQFRTSKCETGNSPNSAEWNVVADKLFDCLDLYDGFFEHQLGVLFNLNMNSTDGMQEGACLEEIQSIRIRLRTEVRRILFGENTADTALPTAPPPTPDAPKHP